MAGIWLKTFVSLLTVALVLLAHTNALDNRGLAVTEAGLSRALVTFGVSRGLNGVISVVQGTEVAVEPVGIGMTFTPGQILDPVNDLVERFSTVVLIAGTAFGLQRVAVEVTATPVFSWVMTVFLVTALLSLWGRSKLPLWLCHALYKVAIVLVIVRFAVPVLAIGGERFYQVFLAPQYAASTTKLEQTSQQLSDLQSTATPMQKTGEELSFFDGARKLMQSASSTLDVRQHIDRFKASAEAISEHAIRLMVVFIFQTIVLPLLSLWLLFRLLRFVVVVSPPK